MRYPGRKVTIGERDAAVVKALKSALNRALVLRGDDALRLDPDNPRFGAQMKHAVQLFQARHVDPVTGVPLKIDGEVGSLTWAALFGPGTVSTTIRTSSALLARALVIAAAQVGVREQPANSNRGPVVEQYLHRVGVPPGNSWCCAFTYWCLDEASRQLGVQNPMVRTGGCMKHWNTAPVDRAARITMVRAVADPRLVRPGQIFIQHTGGWMGHTGFVEEVVGGQVHTIEGNTDASMTREGGGVYRLTRKLVDINVGFIDYSR